MAGYHPFSPEDWRIMTGSSANPGPDPQPGDFGTTAPGGIAYPQVDAAFQPDVGTSQPTALEGVAFPRPDGDVDYPYSDIDYSEYGCGYSLGQAPAGSFGTESLTCPSTDYILKSLDGPFFRASGNAASTYFNPIPHPPTSGGAAPTLFPPTSAAPPDDSANLVRLQVAAERFCFDEVCSGSWPSQENISKFLMGRDGWKPQLMSYGSLIHAAHRTLIECDEEITESIGEAMKIAYAREIATRRIKRLAIEYLTTRKDAPLHLDVPNGDFGDVGSNPGYPRKRRQGESPPANNAAVSSGLDPSEETDDSQEGGPVPLGSGVQVMLLLENSVAVMHFVSQPVIDALNIILDVFVQRLPHIVGTFSREYPLSRRLLALAGMKVMGWFRYQATGNPLEQSAVDATNQKKLSELCNIICHLKRERKPQAEAMRRVMADMSAMHGAGPPSLPLDCDLTKAAVYISRDTTRVAPPPPPRQTKRSKRDGKGKGQGA